MIVRCKSSSIMMRNPIVNNFNTKFLISCKQSLNLIQLRGRNQSEQRNLFVNSIHHVNSFHTQTSCVMAKHVRTSDQYTFSTRFPVKPKQSMKSTSRKTTKLYSGLRKNKSAHDKVNSLSDTLTLAQVKNHKGTETTKMIIKKARDSRKVKPPNKRFLKQNVDSDQGSESIKKRRTLRITPIPTRQTSNQNSSPNTEQDTRRNAELFELKSSQDVNFTASINEFKYKTHENLARVHTFRDLGLEPKTVVAVEQELGIGKPTEIQKLIINQMLHSHHRHVLMAAETGSGKTLAYLLPIFHDLVAEDQAIMNEKSLAVPETLVISGIQSNGETEIQNYSLSNIRVVNRPRAVVVVPSRQLVQQVTDVAKRLSHRAKLRVIGVHSKVPRKVLATKFREPVDLIITTQMGLEWLLSPVKRSSLLNVGGRRRSRREGAVASRANKNDGTTTELTRKGFGMSLNRCTHLVIDEMDTMFDKFNRFATVKLIETIKNMDKIRAQSKIKNGIRTPPAKIIFATATLSNFVCKEMKTLLPDHVEVVSRDLHCTPRHIRQVFSRIDKSSSTKINFLVELLKRSFLDGDKRVLVFCNKTKNVLKVARYLKSKNMNVFPFLSGEKDVKRLSAWVKPFTADPSKLTLNHTEIYEQVSQESVNSSILVSDSITENSNSALNELKKKEAIKPNADNRRLSSNDDTNDDDDFHVFDEFEFNADPSMPMICVATDVASRGLDTLSVTHVILYDCPVTPIDYLHRVGRTGRNGRPGRATSIITKKDVPLMAWIEDRVRKRKSLAL